MNLHIETLGEGPNLVLLHGWALNSEVWRHNAADLAATYRVTVVDLPGHGRSATLDAACTIDAWAEAIAAVTPTPAIWIGWSLGGLIALQLAATQPRRVAKLVLVATNPRYVQASDWPYAMPPALLEQFAQDLETDYQGTLKRFLALQVQDSTHAQRTLRTLQSALLRHPPQRAALRCGVDLLRETDLCPALRDVGCPTLVIHGGRDRIVPPEAGEALAAGIGTARVEYIDGAGHAPFLSHSERFCQALREFTRADD